MSAVSFAFNAFKSATTPKSVVFANNTTLKDVSDVSSGATGACTFTWMPFIATRDLSLPISVVTASSSEAFTVL